MENMNRQMRSASGVTRRRMEMVCAAEKQTFYWPFSAGKAEAEGSSSPATGIPEFWLISMKNADIFSDWIKVCRC